MMSIHHEHARTID